MDFYEPTDNIAYDGKECASTYIIIALLKRQIQLHYCIKMNINNNKHFEQTQFINEDNQDNFTIQKKKLKLVLNGSPTIVSNLCLASNARLCELIELSCKSLNIKYTSSSNDKIRIFRGEGVELFEEDLKYLKQNEILYLSPSGEDFDDSNNFAMYKIIQKIGKGGFGSVYEAKHRITKEIIAIKMIHGSNIKSAKDIDMMFKEISLLKNLNHKNIIKVKNCFTLKHEMKLAIVLEYLQGGDLRQFLEKQSGQYVEEEIGRKIFLQLYSAIQYCHREKIIHRDLKLENIMFADKNYDLIKVLDFGISDYTQAGSVRYFAPEVLSTKAPAHPSIDIWAMGCILYWILVGQSPFPQNSKEEVFNHILKGNYTIPEQAKNRMTKSVQDLIEKMLKVNINERITMAEIAQHEWLRNSVQDIQIQERNEKQEQIKNNSSNSRLNTTQRRSIKNGTKSTQRIQIGQNSWICNVQPGSNRIEFLRKIEGANPIINPQPNILHFNQLFNRNSSIGESTKEIQPTNIENNLDQKQENLKYLNVNSKKNLSQKKILPQIQENNTLSNRKKIINQRSNKPSKDKFYNESNLETNNSNLNVPQNNNPSLLGILTPKNLNSPAASYRNTLLSSAQNNKSNLNKTPTYNDNSIYNENNYIVNKSYASSTNFMRRLQFNSNNNFNENKNNNQNNNNNNFKIQTTTNNNQNEYQLNSKNYFSNIVSSQSKISSEKISPLQSPHSKQPITSLKEILPTFQKKNDNKSTQQKLIQITSNNQQATSITELESNLQKSPIININQPKHRLSHLVASSSKYGMHDYEIPQQQEIQSSKVLAQKRTNTLI